MMMGETNPPDCSCEHVHCSAASCRSVWSSRGAIPESDRIFPAPGFRLGDIVDRTANERYERGVIVAAHGRGETHYILLGSSQAFVIRLGPGHHLVSDRLDDGPDWRRVPQPEWTTEERVRRAALLWEPPTWAGDYEPDLFPFQLLSALLPPAAHRDVFSDGGDWPTSDHDLALAVARWLDSFPIGGAFPTQRQVFDWIRDRWPQQASPEWRALKLAEEAGEVAGAVVKREEGRTTDADVRMETAQVVICAMALAESVGFDLWEAVAEHGPLGGSQR